MEYRNFKVVYRRYASLYFIIGVDNSEVGMYHSTAITLRVTLCTALSERAQHSGIHPQYCGDI